MLKLTSQRSDGKSPLFPERGWQERSYLLFQRSHKSKQPMSLRDKWTLNKFTPLFNLFEWLGKKNLLLSWFGIIIKIWINYESNHYYHTNVKSHAQAVFKKKITPAGTFCAITCISYALTFTEKWNGWTWSPMSAY